MPEHGSVRFRQAAAAKVLGDLLMHDLPEIAFVDVNRDGTLRLQLGATLSDAGDLAAVHAWAEFLDAEMTVRSVEGSRRRVHVSTETTLRGVFVEVWTSLLLPVAPVLAEGGAR